MPGEQDRSVKRPLYRTSQIAMPDRINLGIDPMDKAKDAVIKAFYGATKGMQPGLVKALARHLIKWECKL